MKIEELISKRIRNQLRIHWLWLKKKEDYNEVADFIDSCIAQACSYKNSKKLNMEEVKINATCNNDT